MADTNPLESLEQFVSLLAAVRAQLESAGERIAAEVESLQGGGGEAEAALGAFAETLAAGAERLAALQHEGAGALRAWTEALTAGLGGVLLDAEPRLAETSDQFGTEVELGLEALERERSAWSEDFGELETTLEALEGELGTLVVSADQAFTDLEGALGRTAESLSAAAAEAEGEAQALGGLAEGDLLNIVETGLRGLTLESTERLTPLEENPLGVLGRGLLTRLEESTEAGQVFGHNAIERSADLLDGVAPHWAPAREAAASAADQAGEERAGELQEELEGVGNVLAEGVDVTAGYTPLLPQLPPVRDAVEKISEMLDAMNPFA
jgi:chromosome segregation ATPase